jgi:hypothetical protein
MLLYGSEVAKSSNKTYVLKYGKTTTQENIMDSYDIHFVEVQ